MTRDALAFLALAFAASMAGGLAPTVEGFLERVGLARILAFRSGLLIAVALTDVLPEGWRQAPRTAAAAAAAALALGAWLHRGHAEEHAGHELTHPHVHGGAHLPAAVAALFSHSLIDGVNLGATAFVGGPALWAVGAATALHKVADGFTVTTLFHQSGHARGRALALLVAVSLATPLGAVLAHAGAFGLGPGLAALLLGFAGGSFLFVGGALVAPLLRGRDGDSAWAFAAGLAAMLILRRLAP